METKDNNENNVSETKTETKSSKKGFKLPAIKKNSSVKAADNSQPAKKFDFKDNKFIDWCKSLRVKFEFQIENIKNGGATLIWTCVLAFVVMVIICLAVFFGNLQGSEKVLVPNVVGKSLTNAVLDLGEKELYPKLVLKYSDSSDDIGCIIEQSPAGGAIVKAYRRVTLTVNRGPVVEYIENYEGKNYDDIKNRLDILYASEKPLIKLENPVYVKSELPKGTVISQNIKPETPLTEPVSLYLVVSGGNETQMVDLPKIEKMNMKQVLALMEDSKITFDFIGHDCQLNEKGGYMTYVDEADSKEVELYSRVNVNIALEKEIVNKKTEVVTTQGIFSCDLPSYPYAVPVKLEAVNEKGKITTLVQFNHPGKNVTIPYEVEDNSTLNFYVNGELVKSEQISIHQEEE